MGAGNTTRLYVEEQMTGLRPEFAVMIAIVTLVCILAAVNNEQRKQAHTERLEMYIATQCK